MIDLSLHEAIHYFYNGFDVCCDGRVVNFFIDCDLPRNVSNYQVTEQTAEQMFWCDLMCPNGENDGNY